MRFWCFVDGSDLEEENGKRLTFFEEDEAGEGGVEGICRTVASAAARATEGCG